MHLHQIRYNSIYPSIHILNIIIITVFGQTNCAFPQNCSTCDNDIAGCFDLQKSYCQYDFFAVECQETWYDFFPDSYQLLNYSSGRQKIETSITVHDDTRNNVYKLSIIDDDNDNKYNDVMYEFHYVFTYHLDYPEDHPDYDYGDNKWM